MCRLDLVHASRLGFAASALATLIVAQLPAMSLPWPTSDKLLHFSVFAFLTLLARTTFPQARDLTLFAWLAMFGAAIEVIQAIPLIGRDASLVDWLVDMLAISAMLVVIRSAKRFGRP